MQDPLLLIQSPLIGLSFKGLLPQNETQHSRVEDSWGPERLLQQGALGG